MATRTGIEWTEVTWNPTTGCDRISAGCDNCYALALAGRLKAMGSAKYQHDGDSRTSGPGFGLTVHPAALRQPYTWGSPRIVFVNSMSDLSGGVTILNRASQQFIGHEVGLQRVRQVSRTGGAGR
jgi:protein gp37